MNISDARQVLLCHTPRGFDHVLGRPIFGAGALRSGIAVAALLCSTSALAQAQSPEPTPDPDSQAAEQPAPAAEQPAPAAEQGLADIVVTAQRRSERLQDVPVSVTALSEEKLEALGVESVGELTKVVAGLTLAENPVAFQPYIRGVGTGGIAAGQENSVALYVDNIYITSMNVGGLLNLTNINSVEVLKGPQGTLFGRNAAGGVIHLKTRDPSYDTGGNVSLSYGNYNTFVGTAYLTSGLTEKVAADVAVYYRHQADGYGTNLATGNEINKDKNFTIRSKLLFEPTDSDKMILTVDYSKWDSDGFANRAVPGTTIQWGPPDATHPPPFGAPYAFPEEGDVWDADLSRDPFLKAWAAGLSLQYVHDFSWGTLSSYSSYRKNDLKIAWNATPIPTDAQLAAFDEPEKQFSQEFQLSSLPSSAVKWMAGLYYLNYAVKYDPFTVQGIAQPVFLDFTMKQTIKSPALFAQVTVPVSALGATNITGGLRYTIDRREITGDTNITTPTDPPIVLVNFLTDAKKTYKNFTWRLSIDHHFSSNVMGYASYNRGFRAGAFNTIPPSSAPVNPEFVDAYEVGLKNTLFGGRATLNLAGFYYDYKDLQVTIFEQISATVVNAARARIMGIDADLTIRPTNALTLTVGTEILDHKFTEYPNGSLYTPLTLAQGGGVLRTDGVDLSGNPLPYASDAIVSSSAYYKLPTSIGNFDFGANFAWNSGYSYEASNNVRQKSFIDLAVSAGLELRSGTRISGFVKNLTNEKVPLYVTVGGNPGGYVQALYRPPRTYGIKLEQNF